MKSNFSESRSIAVFHQKSKFEIHLSTTTNPLSLSRTNMVPMPKAAAAAAIAGAVDPLSGFSGLSFFPRTIRASADAPVPAAPKDLDSVHNIMKSLKELRSPEKLMSEAKKIVDGGANLPSKFSSFAENVSVVNDLAAKVKDRPRERRPGLGIARKKASFSLKTSISHPPADLESTMDIDHLEDPDAFFDAYEKIEKANKEIQKQQGGGMDNIDLYKPSNNERRRRPGILGRSYRYEHRYSSTASENDDTWISSQETVYQDIPSSPKDESCEKLVDPDPNLDADLEEVELVESMKKTESRVNDMLEELLSCNDEDLEGQGALNILQERLKIKTLDLGNLCRLTELPDVGRSNILSSLGSRQKPRKSSSVFDSVLKNLNKKPRMEQEHEDNPVIPVSSPTPPRSPFGSISLLKKKILQPNPLRDPFSAEDLDRCAHLNSSPAQPKDKLPGQVATPTPKDVGQCNELESPVEFCNTEPGISDIDSQKVMGNADSENAIMERESGRSRANASPAQSKDKLVGQVDPLKDLAMFSEIESNVEFDSATPPLCNLDTQEVTGNADGLPEQFEDENAIIPSMDASRRQNEESNSNIGKAMNINENELNPSVVGEEAQDDASTKQQINPEQPKVHAAKQQRGKSVAGVKRIRDAHPMRKSLAEAGTSFEAGVRRSKRVKMRPLEYWKGERFLYGRVDDSLKLIGLKYISPGKGNQNLKVKPYILSEKPEHKELLDLAARH